MKYIIVLLLLVSALAVSAQQYTIEADTNICRMTITTGNGQIGWMFLVDDVRYIDINGPEIQIFDGTMSFHDRNSRIVNFASIAALKVQIDAWILSCR